MNSSNRTKKGLIVGIVGMVWNTLLATTKLIIGITSGSISIQSDAFNNFGDVISSGATTASFSISGKKADEGHPYGHGRVEYIVGLAIAVLIVTVGIQFAKSSIEKIITPSVVEFSWVAFAAIMISIFAKIVLGLFYHFNNKKLLSPTLDVAKVDSYQDAIMTAVTLISFSLSSVTTFPIDAVCGLAISVFIILNGLKLVKTTLNPIIGGNYNAELASKLRSTIMEQEEIVGVHDLLLHDYGPNNSVASIHAEISDKLTLTEAHKIIDKVERNIQKIYQIEIVVHIDPVDFNDKEGKIWRNKIRQALQNINSSFTFHDFSFDKQNNIINLDVVVHYDCKIKEDEIKQCLDAVAKQDVIINFKIDYK